MRRIQDRSIWWLGLVAFGVVLAVGPQITHAWSGPGSNNAGAGTDIPRAIVKASERVTITGGRLGLGEVLTFNANGTAAWKDYAQAVPGPQDPAEPWGPQGPQGPQGSTGPWGLQGVVFCPDCNCWEVRQLDSSVPCYYMCTPNGWVLISDPACVNPTK
jgi:hypothetical protein